MNNLETYIKNRLRAPVDLGKGWTIDVDPNNEPVERAHEAHIQEQEQAEIARRAGRAPAAAGPRRSREKPLWKGFVAVCLWLVLLDVALPYSLGCYGYPRISPWTMWWPLVGSMLVSGVIG